MSARKPHNHRARIERASRALLSSNHVAVVNVDPGARQGMMNWKAVKNIPPGRALANAMCDIPHRWSIYVAAMCVDQAGQRYMKSVEVAPQGIYLAAHLTDVIEAYYSEIRSGCNQAHMVGSGWIAIPADVTLDEAQAFRIFEEAGGWNAQKSVA